MKLIDVLKNRTPFLIAYDLNKHDKHPAYPTLEQLMKKFNAQRLSDSAYGIVADHENAQLVLAGIIAACQTAGTPITEYDNLHVIKLAQPWATYDGKRSEANRRSRSWLETNLPMQIGRAKALLLRALKNS